MSLLDAAICSRSDGDFVGVQAEPHRGKLHTEVMRLQEEELVECVKKKTLCVCGESNSLFLGFFAAFVVLPVGGGSGRLALI